jgi:exopolysaccharide biosynthesis polyprenyl glycosylphosphotransferase
VRTVVVIGTGEIARRLACAFRENHALGYRFLGYVAGPDEVHADSDQLGELDDLEAVLRKHRPEEVVIALPGHQHARILNIAHRCQAEDVRLRVVPDLFDVIMVRASLSMVEDIPLIGLRDQVITGYQSIVKRIFDIAVASFCLALALPLFLIIPIAIWLDSRGRVFFAQVRVGENGRLFRMYKFRSMVKDAEDRLGDLVDLEALAEPVFKIPDDPRVTRVGRLLRRTSLDELPQLVNVLKGDMSMVGPRPEEVQVVKHYELWHRKRLSIKPGITGPMQVSGRGELPLDERIKLELMYITQYSILEDVKYLLKTIPAVCRARGAY